MIAAWLIVKTGTEFLIHFESIKRMTVYKFISIEIKNTQIHQSKTVELLQYSTGS